jgi:hypothetical protein
MFNFITRKTYISSWRWQNPAKKILEYAYSEKDFSVKILYEENRFLRKRVYFQISGGTEYEIEHFFTFMYLDKLFNGKDFSDIIYEVQRDKMGNIIKGKSKVSVKMIKK